MTTVTKSAFVEKISHLRKAVVELLRWESPKANLAQTRRIDDIAIVAAGKREHDCTDGRVPAFVDGFTDRTNAEIRAWKKCVEERRLSDARRSGDGRASAGERRSYQFQPDGCLDAGVVDRITGALVDLESLLSDRLANQFDLIDDDSRSDLVGFGDDEKAVDHAGVRIRLRGGEH